jgi:hypothetical protein
VVPGGKPADDRMTGFLFRLEAAEGVPAEPPTLESAVPTGRLGMRFGPQDAPRRSLRDEDADQPPLLVVEEA